MKGVVAHMQMIRKAIKALLPIMCVVFFSACSLTKFVPEGEYLLNKANVKIDAMIVNEETSSAQVSYIDVTSEDLTGKYVITIEELFIYLLDDYFIFL